MGVKENVDLGFIGNFWVVGVEASEQQGGLAEIELPGDGCSWLTMKASVPTYVLFDVIESGLEAVGELVAIDQVSVECRGIEADARVVE